MPYLNDHENMDVVDSDPQPICLSPRKSLPGTAVREELLLIVQRYFLHEQSQLKGQGHSWPVDF